MIFSIRSSMLLCIASLFVGNAMAAQTTTPVLAAPASAVSDWLFNDGASLSWNAIPTATYRIVVSESPNFTGFRENNGQSSCDSTCVTAPAPNASAGKVLLANFHWKARTYYWKVRANTVAGGVSNWSEVRTFMPTSNPAIPTNAYNAAGNSPLSISGSPWLTDMSGGDGTRFSNAITNFKNWVDSAAVGGYANWVKNGRQSASSATQTLMNNNLSATYNATDRGQIIERIRTNFTGTVPANENGIMELLGIRAQCKEFADRTVAAAGGIKRAYGEGAAGSNIRPGMYVFKNDNSHAAIVTEVYWDTKGDAYVQLAESNWGSGWSNPIGQIPWARTVSNTRIVSMANYYAAKTGQ